MKIEHKPQVLHQLKQLSLVEKKKVVRKLEMLDQNPTAGRLLRGELTGLRSLRAWPYRIIYQLHGQIIIIYSIAHRQSVYK